MNMLIEHLRLPLSRIAAAIGLFFLCSTTSYWDTKNSAVSFVLFLIGMFLVAIASLGRMWCSLYIADYKDQKLITKGPYSLCRNPLYFFSMLGGIGIGFATETLTFPPLLALLFSVYYPFVIKSEERRLERFFGADFIDYKKHVPSFFPRFSGFDEPEQYAVNPGVYRNHIFSALWFIWIVGILEVLEGLKEIGFIGSLWTIY